MVGNHQRVGGDMIVVVKIIDDRLMRDALTRQRCQLDTIIVKKEQVLPSGATSCHLETQLTESDEYSNKTAAYR